VRDSVTHLKLRYWPTARRTGQYSVSGHEKEATEASASSWSTVRTSRRGGRRGTTAPLGRRRRRGRATGEKEEARQLDEGRDLGGGGQGDDARCGGAREVRVGVGSGS
jgi:hypothetical protein